MLEYNSQMHILSHVIKQVEVAYSIAYRNNTIHVELDVDSILSQISAKLDLLSSTYREQTGSSYFNSTEFANTIKQADICLHLGPHSLTAERAIEVRQCVVDNGYKLKEH